MSRRPTLSEIAYPLDADSQALAQEWAQAASKEILDWTWRGFERLYDEVLSALDMSQPFEQLERDLASKHFIEINKLWARETGGYGAFTPSQENAEMETRSLAPAKPPAYDIAFVWNANSRIAWPIEAKVVPTPGTLAEYLKDTQKFSGGTAAPFTGEGAQVAYLLTGSPETFLDNVQSNLGVSLQKNMEFSERPHRCSSHQRNSAPDLNLHHLAMFCGPDRRLLHISEFDS